jgi:hypothetical protein
MSRRARTRSIGSPRRQPALIVLNYYVAANLVDRHQLSICSMVRTFVAVSASSRSRSMSTGLDTPGQPMYARRMPRRVFV